MEGEWTNKLYFGDNLPILREHVPDESVDLIYLDPPFNSKATYNVLFQEKNGTASPAQITAFEDFWHWDMEAARAFHRVVTAGPGKVSDLLQALQRFLGQNDMMAYLTMMAVRLVELRRVLKPSGSIYLHCDETAVHYLKILMDAVFAVDLFQRDIIWQRTNVHSDSRSWSDVRDSILFYSKSKEFTWNPERASYGKKYLGSKYRFVDEDGRRFRLDNMTSPGPRPNMMYDWMGHESPPNGWRYSRDTMQRLHKEGRIWYPEDKAKRPQLKRFLDEMPGTLLGGIWTDIRPINSQARERLGYPTQKPEALLERIIAASSNEGDLVLDPFCGCGTTVAVAERLHRRWIGMDITHLAIALMKNRLHDAFGSDLSPYQVIGEPTDLPSARALAEENRHQFEYWALGLVDARPAGDKRKGADKGVDGVIVFFDDNSGEAKRVVIQVKSGSVGVTQVRDLKGVLDREKAVIGALITLEEPTRPMREEAAASGMYDPPGLLPPVPKLQVVTIEELLAGRKLEYPNVAPATFKRAPRQYKARPKGKAAG